MKFALAYIAAATAIKLTKAPARESNVSKLIQIKSRAGEYDEPAWLSDEP